MTSRPQPTGDDPVWSAWKILPELGAVSGAVLAEILDGGQAFRWNRLPSAENSWQGFFSDFVLQVRRRGDGQVEWRAPRGILASAERAVPIYFDCGRPASALVDALPWRSDSHLARCCENFPGLRILRQPFGETLLGFLCSATKQIVQIKQMLALLAERHGSPLILGGGTEKTAGDLARPWKRLPTWGELAEVSEAELRACLLGFRARYIHQTALFLAAHPGWLEETERLDYAEAKARLSLLPGVGEKIADCVLLFGAGRLEAFPVDVWILKTMAARYGLEGWRPAQLAQFGRVHFGPLAGLAQQFLFAYERAQSRLKKIPETGRARQRSNF